MNLHELMTDAVEKAPARYTYAEVEALALRLRAAGLGMTPGVVRKDLLVASKLLEIANKVIMGGDI